MRERKKMNYKQTKFIQSMKEECERREKEVSADIYHYFCWNCFFFRACNLKLYDALNVTSTVDQVCVMRWCIFSHLNDCNFFLFFRFSFCVYFFSQISLSSIPPSIEFHVTGSSQHRLGCHRFGSFFSSFFFSFLCHLNFDVELWFRNQIKYLHKIRTLNFCSSTFS